ncbi:pyridoxamine 5'-phosphate oxidase-domain-containing protein [Immersiella caudata]|uniref:Pyridoxamine 5'-phosphate oxidase-domain-containing protein n=1 Tax=Immersiella caudata TaxID=314043 RepID=A0AA39WQU9_9PEZI|nr:pyridoxamine 5'-phosphate oxidase-domain-containing protein [Immersiella caudata]
MTTSTPRTPAPWRNSFLSHIHAMSQPSFTLSTIHRSPSGTITPRARTCIYRGLWASLPKDDRNTAPRNPHVFESDLPVLTTDVRMEKAGEMGLTVESEGSGGGGPVEAVWWVEKLGTQWRMRGTAWVLGPDADGEGDGAKAARKALRARMWTCAEGEEGWSWVREVTGNFGNLSPGMRGTFRNPPPGQPREIPVEGEGLGLGQTVWHLEDPVARKNFRVVVIVPDEVDQVDLSDMTAPKRWLYVYRGASYKSTLPGGEVIGEWEKVEVWP